MRRSMLLSRLDAVASLAGRVILTFTVGLLAACGVLVAAYEIALRVDERAVAWTADHWHLPVVGAITIGAMIAAAFDHRLANSG